MSDKYMKEAIEQLKKEGACKEYIDDWVRVYNETGMDIRDMADGMDVDAFLDAYECGDYDEMLFLS